MGMEVNIKAFEDTKKLCERNDLLSKSIKGSIKGQRIIYEKDALEVSDLRRFEEKASVKVTGRRTLEAAYLHRNDHVAVLNFTWERPGGRVAEGEDGQQESLCRCTTLKPCLDACEDSFYKAKSRMLTPDFNNDVIFTPGVTVIKEDDYSPLLMPDTEWFDIDVISCIPPDFASSRSGSRYQNPKDFNCSGVRLTWIHEKRLRRILDVALANGCDTVILGAFGCGRAKNPVDIVAQGMADALKDYMYAFKNVEIAVHDKFNNKVLWEFDKAISDKL
ncbi:MAG: TIGR02452 family protein [Clostridiales bacterium]|nr:TIGR02452 family protein [Clostridiales bacterium]